MASSPADGNQMDDNNDALRVAMATSQRLSLEKDRDDNHKNVYKKKVEEFETWLVFNGQDFQMKITKIQMNQDGSVLLTGHITGYFSVKSEAFMEIMTDFDDSFKIASHDFVFESCNEQECETSCDSSRLLNPDGSALDGFSVDNVVIGSFLRFLGPTLNSVPLRYKTPRDPNTPTYDEISQEYVFTYLLRRSCLNHKGQTCQLGEEALKTHQSALKDRWRKEYEAATGSRRQQLQTHDPRQATKRVIAMYLNRRRGSDEAIGAALVRFLSEEERGIPGSALREIASFSFFTKGFSGNVPSRDIEKEWLFRTVILFMVQASVRCFNAAFMCVMGQKIQELSKRESDLSLAQGVRFSLHNDKPTQRKFEKNALIIPHESVNLCALWSLAVLMYMRDMKGAFTKVDFTCAASAARYKLFPGTKGPMSPMCPATFRTWFKQFLVMAGVSICFHITHLARQSMNYFNANAGSPLDEAALNMHGNYSSKQNDREKGYTSPYSEDAALFLSSLAATADKAPDTPIARGGSPFVRLWLLTPQVPPMQVLSKVYATERAYLEGIKGDLGVPGCRPASSAMTKLIDDRRAMLDYYSIVLVNGLCSELDELPTGHFIRTWPLIYQPEFLQYREKFLKMRTAAVDQIEQRRISQTPLNQGDVPVLGRTIATTMVPIIMDAMNRKWGPSPPLPPNGHINESGPASPHIPPNVTGEAAPAAAAQSDQEQRLLPQSHPFPGQAEDTGATSILVPRETAPVDPVQLPQRSDEDWPPTPEWIMGHWNRSDESTWTTSGGTAPSAVPDVSLRLFLHGSGVDVKFETTVTKLVSQFTSGVSQTAISISSLQRNFGSNSRSSNGRSAWTSVIFHPDNSSTTQKNLSERRGVYGMVAQLCDLPSTEAQVTSHNSFWDPAIGGVWSLASSEQLILSFRVPARLPDSMAHVGLPVGSALMTSEVAVGGGGASSLLDVARISGIFFALSGHLTTQEEQKKEKARVKALIAYFKALRNDQGARRRAPNTRRGIPNKSKRTNSRGHGQGRGKGPRRRRRGAAAAGSSSGIDVLPNPNESVDGLIPIDLPQIYGHAETWDSTPGGS